MVAIVLLHFSIELQLELTGIIYLVDPAIRRALQWASKSPITNNFTSDSAVLAANCRSVKRAGKWHNQTYTGAFIPNYQLNNDRWPPHFLCKRPKKISILFLWSVSIVELV